LKDGLNDDEAWPEWIRYRRELAKCPENGTFSIFELEDSSSHTVEMEQDWSKDT
jgi:hypothetical protein